MEDARVQWTTYNNLNQWFSNIKKDILATGLVEDEKVFDAENGVLVSEVWFKQGTERRFINMDETHHNLSITGDKGGFHAVSYHNPIFQRGTTRGVNSAKHATDAYATNAAGEALPLFFIYDSLQRGIFASRLIGLLVSHQCQVDMVAQLVWSLVAFILYAPADQWTKPCSTSVSKA